MSHKFFLLVTSLLLYWACNRRMQNPESAIIPSRIEAHIKTLASDGYLGRQPGTAGEPITTAYLADQLNRLGVAPACNGSYFQEFEITEVVPIPPEKMIIKHGNTTREYQVKEDFIAITPKVDQCLAIRDKEIVFAGFGIVAPEYQWDDYKQVDVRDKIVLVLYNDPGLYTGDEALFQGMSPSLYGSAGHKKQEAFRRGAAGVLTIFHDTGLTGLNWGLVQAMSTRPIPYLAGQEPDAEETVDFSGMISIDMARSLIREAGYEFDYVDKALEPGFTPIPLGLKASLQVESRKRTFTTHNILGLIAGEKRPDEVIVYTAHWDHDGYIEDANGQDSVYNGAIDNATGVAMVLETARAFTHLRHKPDRSILIFFTSAEEMGLLGSKFYTSHPLFPMHKTVCVINSDAAHATERMRIAVNVIKGYSDDMDEIVDSAAKVLGREIIPDPSPQIGAFYRSDHYPFVEKGVPAVWAVGGADPMAGDSTTQMRIIEAYAQRYHQLDDEYYEGFITKNIAFDAQLNFLIGYYLSTSDIWPQWNRGVPYKEIRDAGL